MIVPTRGLGAIEWSDFFSTTPGSAQTTRDNAAAALDKFMSAPDRTGIDTRLADLLNKARNGWTTAPAPGAGLPGYSAPPAPSNDQLLSWTPSDAADAALAQFESDKAAQSQAIAAAEANGSYNPNFLPNLSSDLKTYMIWAGLITGAVVIAGLAIGAKR